MPYKNKEDTKKHGHDYYLKNKERLNNLNKKWMQNNPKQRDEIYARYRKTEKCRKKNRDWAKRNRLKMQEYFVKRYHNDYKFNIAIKLRRRIWMALKKRKTSKSSTIIKLLGCNYEEYKNHIESQFKDGMSWNEVEKSNIHIDHIIPCSKFDLTKEEEQKKCFHYTNLQPLWAKENLSKAAKVEQ